MAARPSPTQVDRLRLPLALALAAAWGVMAIHAFDFFEGDDGPRPAGGLAGFWLLEATGLVILGRLSSQPEASWGGRVAGWLAIAGVWLVVAITSFAWAVLNAPHDGSQLAWELIRVFTATREA